MRNAVRSLLGLLVLLLLGTGAYYTLNNHISFGLSQHACPTPDPTQASRPASSPQDVSATVESSRIHKLTQQLAVERQANEPLRTKIKELISQDILAQNRAESQLKQLTSLRKQLAEARTELTELNEAGKRERESRETESRNVREAQEKLAATQSELNQLREQHAQQNQQLEEAEKSLRLLTRQTQDQNQTITAIAKEKAALAKELSARQATIVKLNKQLAERSTPQPTAK